MFVGAILLGIGFCCIFLSFQTWINIQRTMLYEIHHLDTEHYPQEYYSHLGISVFYFVFGLTNCAVPSKIGYIQEKCIMAFCGLILSLFLASFYYGFSEEIFFTVSVLAGIAVPLLWAAQATYLTQISTIASIHRNSAIFWGILQLSLPVGNGIVFVIIDYSNDEICHNTAYIIIGTLTGITVFGTSVLLFLPKPKIIETNIEDIDLELEKVPLPPRSTLKEARKFFFTREIVYLWALFIYAGMELAFRIGIYSSTIGFIKRFPNRRQLVAISGILIGLGEILAGFLFGVLSLKCKLIHRFGCYPIVFFGFLVHSLCYIFIFLNMPKASSFHEVDPSKPYCFWGWCNSSWKVALACSFGLGFGDACYNTQIYTLLSKYYYKYGLHGTAFSCFKFLQCIGAGITFAYASYLHLKGQVCILFIFAFVGTIVFYIVERRMLKKDMLFQYNATR